MNELRPLLYSALDSFRYVSKRNMAGPYETLTLVFEGASMTSLTYIHTMYNGAPTRWQVFILFSK